ncbi:MAG TPA: adenylate/guanylate cyclase domain-containing protein [bacterium]|nr:adenylate/guanylate cyclase domain-containing protein [bacterium]
MTGKKFSIVLLLAVLAGTIIILSVSLSCIITTGFQSRFYSEEKLDQMKARALVISSSSRNAIAANKNERLAEITRKVLNDEPEIKHIAIFKSKGNAIHHNGLSQPLLESIFNTLSASDNHGELLVVKNFIIDSEPYTLIGSAITTKIDEEGKTTITTGYVALTYQPRSVLEVERTRQIAILGSTTSQTVKNMIDEFLFSEAKSVLIELLNKNRDVKFCYIIAPDNTVMIHPDSEIEGSVLDGDITAYSQQVNNHKPVVMQQYTDPSGERISDLSFLIESNGTKTGVLRIGYSMRRLDERTARARNTTIAAILALLAICITASLVLAKRIAKPILELTEASGRVGRGDLDTRVHIATTGKEIQLLADSFNNMVKGLKERETIKETFSRYVTKQVADEILNNPDLVAPGGVRKEVTILFSDIRGFTTFSEKHPPEEVISYLNTYFSSMIDVIFKYEGTLDKFIGDAIMSVFGAPLEHDDDPMRAVLTAIEMQQRLDLLNNEWNARGGESLRIGIGINTGDVIVGNIGDVRRMEYTVIGDTVNLASRIEGLTKNYNCPIIISGSTYDKVKSGIIARELGEVTVKGKTEPATIYELTGLA